MKRLCSLVAAASVFLGPAVFAPTASAESLVEHLQKCRNFESNISKFEKEPFVFGSHMTFVTPNTGPNLSPSVYFKVKDGQVANSFKLNWMWGSVVNQVKPVYDDAVKAGCSNPLSYLTFGSVAFKEYMRGGTAQSFMEHTAQVRMEKTLFRSTEPVPSNITFRNGSVFIKPRRVSNPTTETYNLHFKSLYEGKRTYWPGTEYVLPIRVTYLPSEVKPEVDVPVNGGDTGGSSLFGSLFSFSS